MTVPSPATSSPATSSPAAPADEMTTRADVPASANSPAAAADVPAAADRSGNPFAALRFRNFRLFFFGQLVSVAGTWMQIVAQQWLVFSLTHSAAWLGIVTGASAIPSAALTLYGGQIADRLPRRRILLWTQTAAMVLAFVIAGLATNRVIPIQAWHIALLAGLSGVVNAFNMPAQQSFVADMVDDRKVLGNAIALNSIQFNVARFVGPVAAGAVLVKIGAAGCFAVNALSFVAVIVSLLLMRLPAAFPRNRDTNAGAGTWEGLNYIRRTPRVLRVLLLVGTASLFAWSASTLYPVFADRFQVGARGFTGMMAANGVGAATAGFLVAAFGERLPRRSLVYGGAVAFAIALLLFAHAPTWNLLLASLVLSGFCMIGFAVNANTSVQNDVPDAVRGRVMAVYTLVFGGLFPLGGLEIGFLSEHGGGPVAAVTINAILFLLVAVAVYLWSRLDRRPHVAAPPVPETAGA